MQEWEKRASEVLALCKPEYKYIAMNKAGDWWIHKLKPFKSKTLWISYGDTSCLPDIELFESPDWTQSLIERD